MEQGSPHVSETPQVSFDLTVLEGLYSVLPVARSVAAVVSWLVHAVALRPPCLASGAAPASAVDALEG